MRILRLFIKSIILKIRRLRAKSKSRKTIDDYFKNNKIIKLNLGCGSNLLSGWLNCDIDPMPDVCYLNCARKMPFKAESVDYIFTEHLIEHLSLEASVSFLSEAFRVLKPSGCIRISTPDLKSFLDMYQGNNNTGKYLQWYKTRKDYNMPFNFTNCINSIFYEHGHKFIFDYNYIAQLAKYCGFKHVRQQGIGRSDDKALCGLEQHGQKIGEEINAMESFVLEASK